MAYIPKMLNLHPSFFLILNRHVTFAAKWTIYRVFIKHCFLFKIHCNPSLYLGDLLILVKDPIG